MDCRTFILNSSRLIGPDIPAQMQRESQMCRYHSEMGHTKSMILADLIDVIEFHFSGVSVSTFKDRVATYYDRIPNVCPDFIYLDAPDHFIPTGDVRGIGTGHPDRMPMSADILTFEHFLTPWTLLLIDGRTASARFLKANFQRSLEYIHDEASDIDTFVLKEAPLGPYNRART